MGERYQSHRWDDFRHHTLHAHILLSQGVQQVQVMVQSIKRVKEVLVTQSFCVQMESSTVAFPHMQRHIFSSKDLLHGLLWQGKHTNAQIDPWTWQTNPHQWGLCPAIPTPSISVVNLILKLGSVWSPKFLVEFKWRHALIHIVYSTATSLFWLLKQMFCRVPQLYNERSNSVIDHKGNTIWFLLALIMEGDRATYVQHS